MNTLEITYSVALRDYPEDLRAADRMKIETRYAQELERAFGTADNVAAALDTMEALQASPPGALSPGDLSLVQHWGKANAAARQAALHEVGDVATCRFEVERIPF
ncbi:MULTISPECIES: hypothetical protein [unclassified Acidovorax]|uniref:hypothetical protein n=1 Tax=unclassified Acidovorax TaxID=2684926 RepID=UPI001C45013E|nr:MULTISPECIES: hypothetical protein [unclassified Acidovorax]MBV7427257.1 hypothetical protein [Acidovorax sp. sif0732]MBV7448381.1 hypothetical protein [Acidovorax sp. sif0715]